MSDTFIPDEWCELLDGLAGSQLKMAVVSFLCEHPNMRFTSGAIPYTGNYTITDVMDCLEEMAEEGIVDAYRHNGIILYALTEKGPWRSLIAGLSGFDLYQRRRFFHDHRGEQVICA